MALKDPVVARDDTIRSAILGVIVLAAIGVWMFSERPLFIGARSWVMQGVEVRPGGVSPHYARMVDEYGVHLPKSRHTPVSLLRARVRLPEAVEAIPTDMHFGYSIIETSVLGAPYWARKDDGYVIYYETPTEFVYAPVTDDYLARVKIPAPKPVSSMSLPWWEYLWGWLFPLALAGWGWFELGAARRRREAEGII
ncbi:hypothetical protein [Sphingomonas immobilis]|uniref:DUF3592 domain-containing protein n=1 Tax=Sphingomonas immobilis TaxID=3063997 RepID=A0ABT8ZY73_9SPHN|nr:hypothetical protein [Sphingomonas sp. CA1-15]MDO7842530.1 hypothetical protein [Sphingomonas sp. CA1-15]